MPLVYEDHEGLVLLLGHCTLSAGRKRRPKLTMDCGHHHDSHFSPASPTETVVSVSSRGSDESTIDDRSIAALASIFDVDVQNAVQHVGSVTLESLSAIGSHRVVPKGFELELRDSTEDYRKFLRVLETADSRSNVKSVDKTFQSKHKKNSFGFDPSELLSKHAVHLPVDCAHIRSTLTNDIHPIFQYDRFYELPHEIYDIITPALRLATQWLTHPAAATYSHTLAFGHREIDRTFPYVRGHPQQRIRKDVLHTEKNAAIFERYLIDIHKNSRIGFDHVGEYVPVFGQCRVTDGNFLRRQLPLDPGKRIRTLLCIHPDFYTVATRLNYLKDNAEPDAVLRYNFFMAVNICHELAHSFEMSHNFPAPECIMNDNTFAEAGQAFEVKLFGGRIWPIMNRTDCAYGISVCDFPCLQGDDAVRNVFCAIPMQYIAKVQQHDFWKQNFDLSDSTILHIERTGAKGWGMNSLNMQIWDDEAKDKCHDTDIDQHDDIRPTFRRTFDGRIVKNRRQDQRKVSQTIHSAIRGAVHKSTPGVRVTKFYRQLNERVARKKSKGTSHRTAIRRVYVPNSSQKIELPVQSQARELTRRIAYSPPKPQQQQRRKSGLDVVTSSKFRRSPGPLHQFKVRKSMPVKKVTETDEFKAVLGRVMEYLEAEVAEKKEGKKLECNGR